MHDITLTDFARSFGTTVDDFSDRCKRMIAEGDFRHEVLDGEKRDEVILEVLKRIETDNQVVGAEGRKNVWFRGWAETLQAFEQSDDLETLVPRFIRDNQIVRYDGNYIRPVSPKFELNYMTIFRTWLFQRYLADRETVYEFGCGTGFNLILIADLFPDKELHGLDFVESSVDLVNKAGGLGPWNIKGHLFDMLTPTQEFELAEGSAVLTFGALEQLAGKFEDFLQFLLKKQPRICVHIEPTIEMYDENTLFDFLAAMFHRKRGYTRNFLPCLQELESHGKLKILKVKRLQFGSLLMEGYMYFVWQPL